MLHHRQQRERVTIGKTKWFSAEDANASAARAMDKAVYGKGKDEGENEDGDGGEDEGGGEDKTKGKNKRKGKGKDKDKSVTGWEKDVVGQEVGRVYSGLGGLGLEGAGAELFEGRVRFRDGEVQYFWVEVEVVRLGAAVEKAKGGLRVDREGAEVYRQRRFDVWARVWCSAERKEGQRRQGGQRLVFECGGDGSESVGVGECEGEGERKEGDGEEGVGDNGKGGEGEGGGEDGEENRDGKGDENGEAGEAEVELDSENAENGDDQNEDNNNNNGNGKDSDNRTSRASSVSSTATLPTPAPSTSPRDKPEITHNHRGTYTTLLHANRAALSTFLELAKPKNCSIAVSYTHLTLPTKRIV